MTVGDFLRGDVLRLTPDEASDKSPVSLELYSAIGTVPGPATIVNSTETFFKFGQRDTKQSRAKGVRQIKITTLAPLEPELGDINLYFTVQGVLTPGAGIAFRLEHEGEPPADLIPGIDRWAQLTVLGLIGFLALVFLAYISFFAVGKYRAGRTPNDTSGMAAMGGTGATMAGMPSGAGNADMMVPMDSYTDGSGAYYAGDGAGTVAGYPNQQGYEGYGGYDPSAQAQGYDQSGQVQGYAYAQDAYAGGGGSMANTSGGSMYYG